MGKWVILRKDERDDVSYIVSEKKLEEEEGVMTTKTPDVLEGIEGFR